MVDNIGNMSKMGICDKADSHMTVGGAGNVVLVLVEAARNAITQGLIHQAIGDL